MADHTDFSTRMRTTIRIIVAMIPTLFARTLVWFSSTKHGRANLLYGLLTLTSAVIAWISYGEISLLVPNAKSTIEVAVVAAQKPDPAFSVTLVNNQLVFASPMHNADFMIVNPMIKECYIDGYPPNGPQPETKYADIMPSIEHDWADAGSLSFSFIVIRFHVDGDPFDAPSVICNVDKSMDVHTFSARTVSFLYAKILNNPATSLKDGMNTYFPLIVGIQSTSASGISVTGGTPVVADSPFPRQQGEYHAVQISDDQESAVHFDWEDETQNDIRDLLLVVMGGVLGIGGSAVLELLKLWLSIED